MYDISKNLGKFREISCTDNTKADYLDLNIQFICPELANIYSDAYESLLLDKINLSLLQILVSSEL